MRTGYGVFLLASAFLFLGCGGGGPATVAGPEPEQEQIFSLGLARGDQPTIFPIVVDKPFLDAGTVELLDAPAGFFEPLAGTLPMNLVSGERAVLRITFNPPAVPADTHQEGAVRLLFRPEGGSAAFPVVLRLDADIETPTARLLETQLNLGKISIGESVTCDVYFQNTSHVTPVSVSKVTLAGGAFTSAPDALAMPATVAPGATIPLRLVCTPEVEQGVTSLLRVFHSAGADPLEATLDANGIASLVPMGFVIDLDPVTHESDWFDIELEPEAVGILLEAWGDPDSVIDLIGFEGPSGKVYETSDMTGPLQWLSGFPTGVFGYLSVEIPDSSLPEVQLVPGGGTYRFRLRDAKGVSSALMVLVAVSQRRYGEVHEGTLVVQVILSEAIPLFDPSDPMRDPKLATVMKTIDAVLGQSGIRLGEVTFSFMPPVFDLLDSEVQADLFAMNNIVVPDPPQRLNLIFVKQISYGITAFAGASPGPWASGMPFGGVVASYDSAQAVEVGVMAAHEISHYLGRFGTAVLPNSDDAHSMLRHPVLHPGLPESFVSAPGMYPQAQVAAASMPPASTWCGTCAHAPVR